MAGLCPEWSFRHIEYVAPNSWPVSRLQAALIAVLILAVLPSRSAAQGPSAPGLPPPAATPPLAAGEPGWRQDFEGPTTSWIEAGGDAQYSLVAHQRVRGEAHSGQGSEWLQVVGQGGSTVLVAHDIGRPWVIDDLRSSVWIYADRPGIQFCAEVALPRTLHPRSGKPLTTNVFGTAYTMAGRWQQLEIVDFPRKLADQVRILRSQLAMNVDGREAYVSRVLLNVYGGPGVTNVWIDDLEVFGHVPSVMTIPAGRLACRAVFSDRRLAAAAQCELPAARRSPTASAARRQAGRLGLEDQRVSDLSPL